MRGWTWSDTGVAADLVVVAFWLRSVAWTAAALVTAGAGAGCLRGHARRCFRLSLLSSSLRCRGTYHPPACSTCLGLVDLTFAGGPRPMRACPQHFGFGRSIFDMPPQPPSRQTEGAPGDDERRRPLPCYPPCGSAAAPDRETDADGTGTSWCPPLKPNPVPERPRPSARALAEQVRGSFVARRPGLDQCGRVGWCSADHNWDAPKFC